MRSGAHGWGHAWGAHVAPTGSACSALVCATCPEQDSCPRLDMRSYRCTILDVHSWYEIRSPGRCALSVHANWRLCMCSSTCAPKCASGLHASGRLLLAAGVCTHGHGMCSSEGCVFVMRTLQHQEVCFSTRASSYTSELLVPGWHALAGDVCFPEDGMRLFGRCALCGTKRRASRRAPLIALLDCVPGRCMLAGDVYACLVDVLV